jgi:RNA polymerase sigma factor (sigma-70 family)
VTDVSKIVSAETQKLKIAEFFRKEKDRLVNYVRRWVDDTAEWDGEDIVQDVMVNLFNAADVTDPIENLSAYIYRSLKNRVVDTFRKRRRTLSLEGSIDAQGELRVKDMLFDGRYDVEAGLQRRELQVRLQEALEELSAVQREVFIATEIQGWSFRELSVQWGVPLGTLLSHKHRAVQKIRSALADYREDTKEWINGNENR